MDYPSLLLNALLLLVTASIAGFQLRKDWIAHQTKRARHTILFLILASFFGGLAGLWFTSSRSAQKHSQDQERIVSLGNDLTIVRNQLTRANDQLETSNNKADELRNQLDKQQKQNIGNAISLTNRLNHSLGSLIPLNGFRLHLSMIGVRPSRQGVTEEVPNWGMTSIVEFPPTQASAEETSRPDSETTRDQTPEVVDRPNSDETPSTFTEVPGVIQHGFDTLALITGPIIDVPDFPRHFLCFDEGGDIQQVAMSIQLSEQPTYRMFLTGERRKKDKELKCEINAGMGVQEGTTAEHKIDLASFGVETKSRVNNSVTVTAQVSKSALEQQHLTHWVTMSSFQGSASVLIRLSISTQHDLSDEAVEKIEADFRREAPKSFVLEVETGIPGQELGIKRHLILTETPQSKEDLNSRYVYLLYSDSGTRPVLRKWYPASDF